MALTWQICWSRTSWQLTWCVCVRCLGIAQWAMYYWWNNSAVLRRLNNLDPVELVKNDPDVCLYVPHAWPMSYWGAQTCELLKKPMCLLTTYWWVKYSPAKKYPYTVYCPDECFQKISIFYQSFIWLFIGAYHTPRAPFFLGSPPILHKTERAASLLGCGGEVVFTP